MGPAKSRKIWEGLAQLVLRVDSTFLETQENPEEFARAVAWELATGYCTRSQYEETVLPYLLGNNQLLEMMRRRRMSRSSIDADKKAAPAKGKSKQTADWQKSWTTKNSRRRLTASREHRGDCQQTLSDDQRFGFGTPAK